MIQSVKKHSGWNNVLVQCVTSKYVSFVGGGGLNAILIRWFSVSMGTGIVSILLHNLPYNGAWLYWVSVIMFALNVLLFGLFLLVSILRYAVYPEIWWAMIRHPAQSLFLGTFPMAFATIVNMFVFVCVPAWGTWAAYFVSPVPPP